MARASPGFAAALAPAVYAQSLARMIIFELIALLRGCHGLRKGGDQVVATLKLEIELREPVLVPISQENKAIIFANGKQSHQPKAARKTKQSDENGAHLQEGGAQVRSAQQGNRTYPKVSVTDQGYTKRLHVMVNGKNRNCQRAGEKSVGK